jgi:lysophospholipase L1-like esterase
MWAAMAASLTSFAQSNLVLSWITNSSIKLQQLIGEQGQTNGLDSFGADTDRQTGAPLLNQTFSGYQVGGTDLGYSFENGNNQLIFLFGDTLYFKGGDVMAWSSTTVVSNGLALNFFTNQDGSTLLVQPTNVDMGAFNVPASGICLGDNTYVVCKTGHTQATGDTNDYSVLTRFVATNNLFVPLRTISQVANGGHFLEMALGQVVAGFGSQEPMVYLWGAGKYRGSDIYLAAVPVSGFESGAGTLYFTGLTQITNGEPTWSSVETNAVPVVVDNPTNGPSWPNDFPSVGNISVSYCAKLGLWLMIYDGGRQSSGTTGVYLSYASAPWGSWSKPELIFNDKRDNGLGNYIYSTNATYNDLSLAGPVIGGGIATNMNGGAYAPYQIARFTQVTSNRLTLYYTLSTWNPYTVVLMQSEFAITPGLDSQPNWVATWGTSPVNPTDTNTNNVGFTNQTLRIIAHTSIGGNSVRLRLANLFSTNALAIGAAHVAIAGANATIVPGSDTSLTFQGAGSVTIPPGGLVLSDPANMAVAPLTNLAISLYVSGTNGPATWHPEANQTNYVSTTGDFTGAVALPVDYPVTSSYYLTDVEVAAASNALAIVALGDSITDGHRSTNNANHRWPDELAQRLAGTPAPLAVVNEGIAGNRLLQNDVGPSGLSRFDRDVLTQAGAAYVIVLLGVNDIGKSSPTQPVSAAQIIAGYSQLLARAHAQKLKYFGGTLTPFGRSVYDKPGNESVREVVNAYIRTNSIFDGMIDFDAAVRDPTAPTNLLAGYDSGDHLHPNDAGYLAMASAVSLSLFQGGVASSFQPDLASTLAGDGTVTVAWPDSPGGFQLQETDSLLPPEVWLVSPLTPALSNGVFSFSIQPSGFSPQFFRLVTTP